jgi:hypothetical protein
MGDEPKKKLSLSSMAIAALIAAAIIGVGVWAAINGIDVTSAIGR